MIKKVVPILVVIASLLASVAHAERVPVAEITKNVSRAVNGYARSISCTDANVKPDQIAALAPFTDRDDLEKRLEAKFAVLWMGDVGCQGGSGTSTTNLAIVRIGAGEFYYVDPLASSPVIAFETPIRHITRMVSNTADTLILEGRDYGPNDANCCPSIKLRFTLRLDQKGNWKLVEKKIIPSKR